MSGKRAAVFLSCGLFSAALAGLAGCSQGPHVTYGFHIIHGFSFAMITSGEWVTTKTVNDVLVRRRIHKGFQFGPFFGGSIRQTNYPDNNQQVDTPNTASTPPTTTAN